MTARFAFGCYSKTPEARGLIKNRCVFGVKLWRLQAQPNSCLRGSDTFLWPLWTACPGLETHALLFQAFSQVLGFL